MIFVPVEPGSEEWFAARAGVVTCSRFKDARAKLLRNSGAKKAGDLSDVAIRYAWQLANERIAGKSLEYNFETFAMTRGKAIEPVARAAYEARYGVICEAEGVVLSDDRLLGYSTDGRIEGENAGIEIKCPLSTDKIGMIWQNPQTAEAEYEDQILGGLLLTEWDYIDLVVFAPWLSVVGKDLFVKRIWRDESKLVKLKEDLNVFLDLVDQYESILRAEAPRMFETPRPDSLMLPGDDDVAGVVVDEPLIVEGVGKAVGSARRAFALLAAATREMQAQAAVDIPVDVPADDFPRITLGMIHERLGITVSQKFLSGLGIHGTTKQKAVLYRASDWPAICDAIAKHVTGLRNTSWDK